MIICSFNEVKWQKVAICLAILNISYGLGKLTWYSGGSKSERSNPNAAIQNQNILIILL